MQRYFSCESLFQSGGEKQSDPDQDDWTNRPNIKLRVLGRIGAEGWSYLVGGIKKFNQLDTNPSLAGLNPSLSLKAYKHVLQEANQEDLRTIWDWDSRWLVISRQDGLVQMNRDGFKTSEEWEHGWARLLEILHPNEDES